MEEKSKSSDTIDAVDFSRNSSDKSALNDTCAGPSPTTDGRAYKRKKLHGMSVALLSEENAIQHNASANDGCSASKCNIEHGSTYNMMTGLEGAASEPFGECTSAKELCISVLKSCGLLGARRAPGARSSEITSYCDANPSQSCKTCGQSDNPSEMLICDLCEEAFHLPCCDPEVEELPVDDEWYCQPCFRKNSAEKSFNVNDAKLEKKRRMCRDLDLISFTIKDTELYTTGVLIGKDFQAEVPDWPGPSPIDHDCFGEPSEMDPTISTGLKGWDSSKSAKPKSIGNWIQCRAVVGTSKNDVEILCGKWRRAPLFVHQTDDWDCSCALPWDPVHADCAVPQELETEEVRRHLQYIDIYFSFAYKAKCARMQLRPRLEERKRRIDQT